MTDCGDPDRPKKRRALRNGGLETAATTRLFSWIAVIIVRASATPICRF